MKWLRKLLGLDGPEIPEDRQKKADEQGGEIEVIGNPGQTYEIVEGGKAIKCLRCGRTSWHPEDVSHRYCGACHAFHKRPQWSDV